MDGDGTKAGYDLELTRAIAGQVSIPVIASGGAGTMEHFREAFTVGGADAALAASLFHFKEMEIRDFLRVNRHHHTLAAEFIRRIGDQPWIHNRCRIDRHLPGREERTGC